MARAGWARSPGRILFRGGFEGGWFDCAGLAEYRVDLAVEKGASGVCCSVWQMGAGRRGFYGR